MATKFGSQNFGYQIWFYTRLLHTVVFYMLLVWYYEMLCQKWRNKMWNQSCDSQQMQTVCYEHIATSRQTVKLNCHVNSLAPGGFENIFQNVFFKLISWIDTLSNSCETALRSMPQNPSDDKSTLVQVMAWCRQAASHYLSQCCPRSLSPYGVTRPQWVKHVEQFQQRWKLSQCLQNTVTVFKTKFFN